MARTAGCEHIVKNESGYEPFSSIVQVALSKRGSNSDDYSRHPEFNAPLYVVRMCEEIHQSVQASGVHDINLRALLALESTCTGADYQHKLALRCHSLRRR